MSIWGNVILPQKDGFLFGSQEPNVPCLWFNTGGGSTPADPDVTHGMLLYRDDEDVLHPLYPMTTMAAVYGLDNRLDNFAKENKDYVDGRATTAVSVTLPVSGWTGSGPYTQTIAVQGLTDGRRCMVYPAYGDDAAANLSMREACGYISYARRSGNSVVFTCLEDKPEVDVSIIAEMYV